MGNKSRKTRTQELLTQYFAENRPWKLRNKIIMLNERLIGWTAKHFVIDGYVEYEDLKQEGVIEAIRFLDESLTADAQQWFSVRLLRALCVKLQDYQFKQMCQFGQEHYVLRDRVRLFHKYMKENTDEWCEHTIEEIIEHHKAEIVEELGYGWRDAYNVATDMRLPTWFQERVDADEIAVEDEPYEIAKPEEVIEYLFRKASLNDRYCFVVSNLLNLRVGEMYAVDDYGHCKSIEDVADTLGLTRERVRQIFLKGIEKMRDMANYVLVMKRTPFCTDLLELCGQGLVLNYLNTYHYEPTFEQDFAKAFPDEYTAVTHHTASSKRGERVVHGSRGVRIPRYQIAHLTDLAKYWQA